MENNYPTPNHGASAKDFFLHLGMMVALYAVAISFLNLLFRVIDRAFPLYQDMSCGFAGCYNYATSSPISLPVATLIIVFPIFIGLAYIVYRSYISDPSKKDIWIRRWLTYITLFVAGVVLAGDLVTVLYKFLDGQDITGAFLLKALAVLVVMAAVFWYFLSDIRDRATSKMRKYFAIVSGVLILLSIILGFSVIGSPRTQRLYRQDEDTLRSMQSLQWSILNDWQRTGDLPNSLSEAEMSAYLSSYGPYNKIDSIRYERTGEVKFNICANFNFETPTNSYNRGGVAVAPTTSLKDKMNVWTHPAGNYCFEREIDPEFYPRYKDGVAVPSTVPAGIR